MSTAIANRVNGNNYLGVRFACEEGGHGQPFWQRSVSPERMNGEKNSMLIAGRVSRGMSEAHFPSGSARVPAQVRARRTLAVREPKLDENGQKWGVKREGARPGFLKGCENKGT
jgi:hypothetical protein